VIRHVIVFNAEAPYEQVLAMAERAQRVLSTIPGVTDVRFGVAVEESARYRYLFDIGLADESVVGTYRVHPVHVRFAEEQFRPLAQDRITTDYRLESLGPITPAK
jgi:fructose-bisphosphate aldolase class II